MNRLVAYAIGGLLVGCRHPGEPDPSAIDAEAAAAAVSVFHTRDQAPAWTVAHGEEFWRRPKGATRFAPSEVNFGVRVSAATESQAQPSVASNGTDYLVAWTDRRSGIDDI